MFFKLILAIVFIGIIALLVIGYEVYQIRKLKIPDKDINDCFKEKTE